MWQVTSFVTLVFVVSSYSKPITDPLPSALIEPFSISIRCAKGSEFHYLNSKTAGLDVSMSYSCGKGKPQSQVIHCVNGLKATYRRDLIPEAMKKAAIPMCKKRGCISYGGVGGTGEQEPNFGLFATGPRYDLKNGAVIVFACMNPKK